MLNTKRWRAFLHPAGNRTELRVTGLVQLVGCKLRLSRDERSPEAVCLELLAPTATVAPSIAWHEVRFTQSIAQQELLAQVIILSCGKVVAKILTEHS